MCFSAVLLLHKGDGLLTHGEHELWDAGTDSKVAKVHQYVGEHAFQNECSQLLHSTVLVVQQLTEYIVSNRGRACFTIK